MDEHSSNDRVDELLELAEEDTTLADAAKASVKVLAQPLDGLEKSIDDLEAEIVSAHAQSEKSRLHNGGSRLRNS